MKPKARIFDIDGTLCDVTTIRHHVMGGNRNFDAFHRASIDCPPIPHVVEAVHKSVAEGVAPLLVTARLERFRSITSFWLAMHDIPSHDLLMRPDHDFRPDHEVKQDILNRILNSWDVVEAWDDNPSVIENTWIKNNIPYVLVPGWIA